MNTPHTPPDRKALTEKLVHELSDMRNALVQLSLCLKDWQFEMDQKGRQAARQQVDATLDHYRLKQNPCEKQSRS